MGSGIIPNSRSCLSILEPFLCPLSIELYIPGFEGIILRASWCLPSDDPPIHQKEVHILLNDVDRHGLPYQNALYCPFPASLPAHIGSYYIYITSRCVSTPSLAPPFFLPSFMTFFGFRFRWRFFSFFFFSFPLFLSFSLKTHPPSHDTAGTRASWASRTGSGYGGRTAGPRSSGSPPRPTARSRTAR